MTSQNLLISLSSLLKVEFEKANLKYDDSSEGHSLPHVFIGSLPKYTQEDDYPHVVILPPMEAENDGETRKLPIKLLFGVQVNKADAEDTVMDILSLVERTEEILMRNSIVGGAFRRTGAIKWGVDFLDGVSLENAIGELDIIYETSNTFQEAISE